MRSQDLCKHQRWRSSATIVNSFNVGKFTIFGICGGFFATTERKFTVDNYSADNKRI